MGEPTKALGSTSGNVSNGCLSLVECAHVAFNCLRSLQSSGTVALPELQLESGLSSFVNKLIALRLYEHAFKEVRVLKRRLDSLLNTTTDQPSRPASASATTTTAAKVFGDLLDFAHADVSAPLLNLIISTQLQALRILHGMNKTPLLPTVLPLLRLKHTSSPFQHIKQSAKTGSADRAKCSKQLETLSQTILSLTCSLSTKDDSIANEPKLSARPEICLETQQIAFALKLHTWEWTKSRGDVDKEIFQPFSKCLQAFTRRTQLEPRAAHSIVKMTCTQILDQTQALGCSPSRSSLMPIYEMLAAMSQEAGRHQDAVEWMTKVRDNIDTSNDTPARQCSVAARLLALLLKTASSDHEQLTEQVLAGLQGPLRGSSAELDELLLSVCTLRKTVMSMLIGSQKKPVDDTLLQKLQSFTTFLPRFCLRWLGKPPATPGATKELLRFEQRRQLLKKYAPLVIDSTLMVEKVAMDKGALEWEQMDSVLQDVLGLLEHFEDAFQVSVQTNPSNSYHVKVSHFYYQQHLALRRTGLDTNEKPSLRALRRSIDSVKNASPPERSRAQLLVKWERFADLCRVSGRKDDAIDTIRSIRDHLLREDTGQDIARSLSTQPVAVAWKKTAETEALSRAVCNLAKLEKQPADWTWLFEGSEKFVALEHDIHFVFNNNTKSSSEGESYNSIVNALLEIYDPKRYPVRRFRTITRVTLSSLGQDTDNSQWQSELQMTLQSITDSSLFEDDGLARYVPHLHSLAACALALIQDNLDDVTVQQAIGHWKSVIAGCTTSQQLLDQVDDPEQLLTMLQSLADFARIRGLQLLASDALELSSKVARLSSDGTQNRQFSHASALILQQLQLGQSSKAQKVMMDSEKGIAQVEIASDASAGFHLAAAEYYLAVADYEKAEVHIQAAQTSASSLPAQVSKKTSGVDKRLFAARASSIASLLALERGDSHHALELAKAAVQSVFHDWAYFESHVTAGSKAGANEPSHDTTEGESALEHSSLDRSTNVTDLTGPRFWKIASALFEFTCRLSWVYAHFGLYQETLYYAEQAQNIAFKTRSSVYTLQATAWLAFVHRSAGDIEKAAQLAGTMLPTMNTIEPTYANVRALCQLSNIYHDTDPTVASEIVAKADYMIKMLADADDTVQVSTEIPLEDDMAKLSIVESSVPKPTTRRAKPTRAVKSTRAKTVNTKAAISKAKTTDQTVGPAIVLDVLLRQLQAAVAQQRSWVAVEKKEWLAATTMLESTTALSTLSMDTAEAKFLQAVSLVGHSLEQMGHDSVFSVIQESTLSFPAIAGGSRDRASIDRASLPRSPASRPTLQETASFQEGLRRAHGFLFESHSIAARNGNASLVHRVAQLLQNVSVLLSTTVATRSHRSSHSAHATCSVEMARNLIWRRERKALAQDGKKMPAADWPMLIESSDSNRRSSLEPAMDMARFQRDFVDIIPRDWNVVSVSLGAGQHDLCITKLQAGHSPFAIRLPLERANSRDADIDVFDFHQGRAELLEVIKDINRTCHDARDMSQKGAKAEWWAEREALDERLKDLLDNVEQTWLGGFKGVFAPSQQRPELLARFQRSFLDILDKHLPSRRQVRGKKLKSASSGPKITLDPRIYELFVSLGDATAPEADLDEPLNDLLYFVIDILQFNGERNAYDEIDFDAMVVDTFDAIHSYQLEARSSGADKHMPHTILVVDKALHIFPWESLPCMEGSPVSRIPSLACLRRLILEQKMPGAETTQTAGPEYEDMEVDAAPKSISTTTGSRRGHHISIRSGSYILNPGADLTNTQSTFGRPLASMPPTWTSIESRIPTEDEFETSLTTSDLLLYFGHGSGAQYIRGRTVRKMNKCRAVALLMGCSSASLADVGEFECHGPVWNYMLAGSPAVAGTLWDVTDRDIDRFAGAMFEEWGLMPRGTFSSGGKDSKDSGGNKDGKARSRGARSRGAGGAERGKGKTSRSRSQASDSSRAGGANGIAAGDETSLIEAIVKAREACRFRYLTAAAAVVYGIPVYIGE